MLVNTFVSPDGKVAIYRKVGGDNPITQRLTRDALAAREPKGVGAWEGDRVVFIYPKGRERRLEFHNGRWVSLDLEMMLLDR